MLSNSQAYKSCGLDACYPLFEPIGDQREHLCVLIQQQHDAKVAQPLVGEPGRSYQFQAFDLSKMSRIAEHVDVKQLGDVVVKSERICLFEGRTDLS